MSIHKSLDLTFKKGYFTHVFRAQNLDYVRSYSERMYYWIDYISGDQRGQFLVRYESHKDKSFRIKEEYLAY